MVVRYAVIKDVGRWSVCLPGFKTTAVFLFAMTTSLRIILLLFISLASLFSSEIIFEMCSTFNSLEMVLLGIDLKRSPLKQRKRQRNKISGFQPWKPDILN